MRLISYNYSQLDQTRLTFSSQNQNFPAQNIKHEHRSKHWRSNGNFTITTLNNKIEFLEGVTTLNTTIAVGNYTIQQLKTTIADAMSLVSSNSYLVTYSEVTGLWSVSSNVVFTLNYSSDSIFACLGFIETKSGSNSYTGTNIAIHTDEHITFDLKTTEEIDSVILLWPKEIGVQLSDDAEIKIQANATNVWTSPAVDQVIAVSDNFEIAAHYFATKQSYRYWRLSIKDSKNPNLYVSLGVIIIGNSEQIEQPDVGFSFNLNDRSRLTTTDFGNTYTDEYPIFSSLDLNFANMDYNSAKAFIDMYLKNGTKRPVFVSLDPEETIFETDSFAIYGKFSNSLGLGHIIRDLFQSSLSISEIA